MMRTVLLIVFLGLAWLGVSRYAHATPHSGGQIVKPIGGCDNLPQPSEKALMVFAGFYEGAAVSTVKLPQSGSQAEGTGALDVVIRPGVGPIYLLVAGSRVNVLRFSGWTRRLERVIIVTGLDYPTAVTGLPADVVTFADARACGWPLSDIYKIQRKTLFSDAALAGIVKRPFPRDMSEQQRQRQQTEYRLPDLIGGGYDPAMLTISDWGIGATIYKPHDHAGGLPDWYVATDAADYDPAGIFEVELNALITPVEATRYSLLPSRAGLGQLLRDGKIQGSGSSYRIVAPITIPDGLFGAQSVTFTLAPGVDRPVGDLGHSKLLD